MQRPTGVTILAVLAAIGGVLALLGGLGLLALGGVGLIAGLILLVSAALSLAFAYGAWTLKPWGWLLGMISYGLSLVSNVLSVLTGSATIGGVALSVIIAIIVLYYLNTPEVKRAFGRS
jgi:uncharacterized membrane protein (DUF2068 family)